MNRWWATALAAVAIAGCSSGKSAATVMHLAGDPSQIINSVREVPRRTPYVLQIGALCVDKGVAAPADVEPIKADGARLLGWGVRLRYPGDPYNTDAANPSGMAVELSSLPGFAHGQVTATCSQSETAVQLDVSIEKVAAGIAAVHGFTVHYTAGGRTGTVRVPFTVYLCPHICAGATPTSAPSDT